MCTELKSTLCLYPPTYTVWPSAKPLENKPCLYHNTFHGEEDKNKTWSYAAHFVSVYGAALTNCTAYRTDVAVFYTSHPSTSKTNSLLRKSLLKNVRRSFVLPFNLTLTSPCYENRKQKKKNAERYQHHANVCLNIFQ